MGLASLAWPFSWDAGIFSWVAASIRAGALPYLDAWDAKGPFAYYAYAAVQGGGPRMLPVRVLDLGVMAMGASAVASIVASAARGQDGRGAAWQGGSGWAAGAWTGLLLMLAYYSSDYWNTAQPDAWIAALSAVAMLLLLRPAIATRPVTLAVASLLLGLGVLQKPTFAAWLLLPPLAVLVGGDGDARAGASRRLGLALLATLVALLPAAVVAWWFHRQGAWPALVEGYLTVNLEVSRSAVGGVLRALPWSLQRLLTATPLAAAVPGAVLGVLWLWRTNRRAAILLTAWTLTAWLMAAAQRRYFPYHWHPLLLGLAPLAGVGYAAALSQRARDGALPAGRTLALAAMGIMVLTLVLPLQVRVRDALARATGRMDQFTYLAQFPPGEAGLTAADLRLAEYLGTHTTPSDRVMVWDSPLANVLSGRRSPTRVGFFFPLVTPQASGGSYPPGPAQQRLRAEYLAGLDAPGTTLVAVTDAALRGVEPQPRKSIPMLFPELAERLATQWIQVDSVGAYRILARRAP